MAGSGAKVPFNKTNLKNWAQTEEDKRFDMKFRTERLGDLVEMRETSKKRILHTVCASALLSAIGFAASTDMAHATSQTTEEALSACTNQSFLDPLLLIQRTESADNCAGPSQASVSTQALGESHQRSVDGMQGQLLNGGSALGPFFVFSSHPQGRLAFTDHDGLTGSFNPTFKMPEHHVDDFTVMASIGYDLTNGRMARGGMKDRPVSSKLWQVGAFVGYENIKTELGATPFIANTLNLNSAGEARNNSLLIGGYSLMAWKKWYYLSIISGNFGHTDVTNNVLGANTGYDSRGFVSGSAVGFIKTLRQSAGGMKDGPRGNALKMDVRAGYSYSYHEGDAHTLGTLQVGESESKTIAGSASVTFFKEIISGDAVKKPYIKTGVKHRFDHENTLVIPTQTIQGNTFTQTKIDFDDNDTFFNVEGGLAIAKRNGTFNGSMFYETNGDSDTVGGRLTYTMKLGQN